MLSRTPLSILLLLTSAAVALWSNFGARIEVLEPLFFDSFSFTARRLVFTSPGLEHILASGEYWRLITPIFIHFSLLHLIFNGLWIWVFARRVEEVQGILWLLVVVLVTALASNLAQALVRPGSLFGGLSGVVYGVLAYCGLLDRLQRRRRFDVPDALLVFMLLWLGLGYTGLIDLMGFGKIANTAHLAGLIAGLVLAIPVWLVGHFSRSE